jgi:hypothetical protein
MQCGEQENCVQSVPRAEQIARLNDELRKKARGGVIVVTRGVRDMATFCPFQLLNALARYDAFDPDNDPHGERDFGDLELDGTSLLWKIDYYDNDREYSSPDPADPSVTQRVLTVMLPEEW